MKLFLFLLLCFTVITTTKAEIDVKIWHKKTGDTYEFFADNNEYCATSIHIKFDLKNMVSSVSKDTIIVVPAKKAKYKINTIKPSISKGKFSFKYEVSYIYGDVTLSQFDSDYVYCLPYEKGKKYRISQGYYGKASHQGINALDFVMPIGAKVHSARGGTVVEVVDSNNKSCFSEKCKKYGNYIIIIHSDGTFANYSHLDRSGARVKKGQKVEKGEFIGLSGNTGYSSGPHLHFAVFLPRFGEQEYIQTYFKTKKNPFSLLKENKFYKRIN